MATVLLTNLTAADVHVADLYTTLKASSTLSFSRKPNEISGMSSVAALIQAGTVSMSVTYTAAELASGLMAPPAAVEAADMAPVAALDTASGLVLLRVPMTAGAAGTADDVTVYAANALPYKFRVVDAWAFIATNIAASTLTVRDEAAGAGSAVAAISSNATGRVQMTGTATAQVSQSTAAKGLFIRRSDRGVAGEVYLLCRRES